MKTASKTQPNVTAVTWETVRITVGRQSKDVAWSVIRIRARDLSDAQLRAVYGELLRQAERMAAQTKAVEIRVSNHANADTASNVPQWEAGLYDMAGQLVSGRLIAADWGLTGTRHYAERDASEARERLAARGYDVR
jgi:hypothetical protein